MRVLPRALAVTALIATAFLLAACGGSEETTESTPAATAVPDSDGGKPNGVERQPKAEPTGRPARDGYGTKDPQGEEKQGDDKSAKTGKRDGDAGDGDSPRGSKGKRPSGCPKGSSAEQCAEAGEALEKSGSSRPVPADECPPALDAATCEQAGKVYAEAEEGSRPVQPNECPRAMTEEQCRQAGEAYAEATK
jgi:hypothetical protein